tara:strand:- start:65942 stop:66877 length:936 start_codon:yes stop_codon:yes gene_type:complete
MALPPTKPRSVLVNLALFEPGMFAMRRMIQRNPHGLIEGLLLAAKATGSDQGFIVSPLEDHSLARMIDRALSESLREGVWGNTEKWSFNIRHIRLPKSLLYDQDSFLLASLSGQRPGYPHRKEFLCAQPVHIHRAEELYALVAMASDSGGEFMSKGSVDSPGVYLVTVGGDVARATTVEAPGGSAVAEIMAASGHDLSTKDGWLRWGGVLGHWYRLREVEAMPFEISHNDRFCLRTFQYPLLEWYSDESALAAKRAMSFFTGDQSCGACLACSRSTTGLSKWSQKEKQVFSSLSKCSFFSRACEASEGPAW